MDNEAMHKRLQRLLQQQRWAALATADTSATPMASMVGYAMGENASMLYLHLSRLAAHTGNLLATGKAALVVSEHDTHTGDPQELTRVTLQGTSTVIMRDSAEYAAARARYLQRLPDAARLFEFPDFLLFRLNVESARFVGGFAQARNFTHTELARLA